MRDYFTQVGPRLLANGYLIIPIKPTRKSPALSQWQKARIGSQDIPRYAGCGVGILTGQGASPVVALDVDSNKLEVINDFLDWCREALPGIPLERMGQYPKTLLLYRASEANWTKTQSISYQRPGKKDDRHQLEVLGRGQQFVAYHTHPGTKRPYEWTDIFGGAAELAVDELPVLTSQHIARAVAEFQRLAEAHGLEPKDSSERVHRGRVAGELAPGRGALETYTPPVGMELSEARTLLEQLPDAEDYDTWLQAGMALHHEFNGAKDALDLWDSWSSEASNYAGREDIRKRWDSFAANDAGRHPITMRWLIKTSRSAAREAKKAEFHAELEEARDQIATCDDPHELLQSVAPKFGRMAANDTAARVELISLLQTRFRAITNATLSKVDARNALAMFDRSAQAGVDKRREKTEFGNTERMLDRYAQGLMYVPELDQWHSWTGSRWRPASHVELEHLAKTTVRALVSEIDKIDSDSERQAWLAFCAHSQRAFMVKNMVRLAQSDPRIVVPVWELDRRKDLLGVANGAVDLRTGKLQEPDPGDYITLGSHVEYDPEAAAPLWDQTVSDVFHGDADMVAFFQRIIGYSLLGRPDEDLLVIPYGSGANGKSTVLGAIRDVLGRYARMAAADTFLISGQGAAGSGGQAREDILRLRGARFVYVSEPEEGAELRESIIKSMTGGEAIPARGLWNKHTVEVHPTWCAFMPTNHRPIVKGDDHAIWRRLMLIPFTRNFDRDPEAQKDPDRATRLRDEEAGILRWCVEGAMAYLRQGLNTPQSVENARHAYREDMDLLGDWLLECCEVDPAARETTARLWASWEAYARARGELRMIPSSRSLGRRLASRFHPMKLGGGKRGFKGLKLKNAHPDFDDERPADDLTPPASERTRMDTPASARESAHTPAHAHARGYAGTGDGAHAPAGPHTSADAPDDIDDLL